MFRWGHDLDAKLVSTIQQLPAGAVKLGEPNWQRQMLDGRHDIAYVFERGSNVSVDSIHRLAADALDV